MGGSSSRVELPQTPNFDISDKATVPYLDVQELQNQASSAYNDVSNTAQNLISQNSWLSKEVNILSIVSLIAISLIMYFYWGTVSSWGESIVTYLNSLFSPTSSSSSSPEDTYKLNIISAIATSTLTTSDPGYHVPIDVTSLITQKVGQESLNIIVDDKVGCTAGDILEIKYNYSGGTSQTISANFGSSLQIVFAGNHLLSKNSKSVSSPATSGLTDIKDAKILQTIQSLNAPANGPYGYQFWMYVTDWNYKFGQEKNVFSRHDSSRSISNPSVTLHPSDNIMKISISVYPNEQTSKNDPAPVGNTSATDDVFLCEIPNIPIQQWVAVTITVDTRVLDVYLNGQLVKSCQLTGVAKPALGDILLNEEGGFAGWMCSFNSYSRALQPADAQGFSSIGSPCKIPGDGNYSTKFGFFNSGGKEVTKYVF